MSAEGFAENDVRQMRLMREDHLDQCIRGWQEVAPLWSVRRCPHGRIQRREPGPTAMRHDDHRWVDLSRLEHPILWSRARRSLTRPTPPAKGNPGGAS